MNNKSTDKKIPCCECLGFIPCVLCILKDAFKAPSNEKQKENTDNNRD